MCCVAETNGSLRHDRRPYIHLQPRGYVQYTNDPIITLPLGISYPLSLRRYVLKGMYTYDLS